MESRAGVKEGSLPIRKELKYPHVTSVKLTESDVRKTDLMLKDRKYFSRSEIIREGIRRIFQEEYPNGYVSKDMGIMSNTQKGED